MGFYRTGHYHGIARNDLLNLNAMDNASGCENCERAQKRTNQASCRNRPPVPTVAWTEGAGEIPPYPASWRVPSIHKVAGVMPFTLRRPYLHRRRYSGHSMSLAP